MTAQWQRYGQNVSYFIVQLVILTFLFKRGGGS